MVRSIALFVWLCVFAAEAHAQVASFTKISAVAGVRSLDDGDAFGSAVAPLGDLDGNGVPDLAVGAFMDDDEGVDNGGSNSGAVWILFLRTDGTVKSRQKISATEGLFGGVLNRDNLFGISVAPLELGWVRLDFRHRLRPERQEFRYGLSVDANELYLEGLYLRGRVAFDDVIHDDAASTRARIVERAFRGAEFLYTLALPSGNRLLCMAPSHHDHYIGEEIGIRLEVEHLVLFPSSATCPIDKAGNPT